tara:strand:- start:286 stop:1266 length:981 start_codon:yes stop_codon:yes gene_type:complete
LKKIKLLISAPVEFLPDLKKKMIEEFDCIFSYGSDRTKTEKLLKENEFNAWLVSPCPTYFINSFILDLCPSLIMLSTPSTGSNHLDVNYLKKKGIEFFSLKGTSVVDQINASSEFTFNLMISTIRNTPFAYEAALDGNWRNIEHRFRGRELNGLNLGIIGYGRIGKNLSRYSLSFGMKVIAYDPYIKINDPGVHQVPLIDNLLTESDVIAVCVHLDEKTYKMMNDVVFNKMKNGVYFINTSRGDVVDENALLKYLNNGKIKCAGLDVISDELSGDVNDHPLVQYARDNDNLIITPHMAGLTFESEEKAQTAAFNAIRDYLKPTNKD